MDDLTTEQQAAVEAQEQAECREFLLFLQEQS